MPKNITPTVGPLTAAILLAKRDGLRYVVWDESFKCYIATCVSLGRKIVWDSEK